MKTIIQVLGNYRQYNYVKYQVKYNDSESIHEVKLSSNAIYNCFKDMGEKSKIIFYIPESLISNIVDDFTEAKKYIENTEKFTKMVNKDLTKLVDNHVNYECRIISSIGYYPNRNTNYALEFNNFIENIIIEIFFDLIKIENDLIFDLSTGFNLYTQALSDVSRNLMVYNKLKRILQDDSKIKIQYAIVPPIIPSKNNWTYPIMFTDVNVKAFFEFPIKNLKNLKNIKLINLKQFPILNTEMQNIANKFPKIRKKHSEYIENIVRAFNSIKYNTPLAFYIKEIVNLQKYNDVEDSFFDQLLRISEIIINNQKIEQTGNKLTIYRIKAEKNNLINLIFAIAINYSIKDFFYGRIKNTLSTTKSISNIFKEVYQFLGFGSNARFLERDINNIEVYKDNLKENKSVLLQDVIRSTKLKNNNKLDNIDIKTKAYKFSDEKRNFFAHSGLLSNFTLLKLIKQKNTKEILLSYMNKESIFDRIKKWLLHPEE